MTNLALPRPYRDELVYSVIARHFAYFQPKEKYAAYEATFGRTFPSIKYVIGANNLAARTRLTWGKSATELIEQHTLLPYYGSFLAPKQYLECVEEFSFGKVRRATNLLGSKVSSVTENEKLKFCKSCAAIDMDTLGETYWRRSHQISGFYVCTLHGEILSESDALTSQRQPKLQDATTHAQSASVQRTLEFNAREFALAKEISFRCEQILHGHLSTWTRPRPGELYQSAARENGYQNGLWKFNFNGLAEDFVAFFHTDLLAKLGINLPVRTTSRSRLFGKIFYGTGGYHPLLHVLLQTFFDKQAARSISRALIAKTSWKCPNPYAGHDESFRVPQINWGNKRGIKYLGARCSCGFVFSFRTSLDSDPSMPLVTKVRAYGSNFMAEAQRLYAEHGTVVAVATTMGISTAAARRLISGRKSEYERSKELHILRLRMRWTNTQCRNAYRALMRIDRAWMVEARMRKPRSRPLPIRSDHELADQIRDAAQEIGNEVPPRKVTGDSVAVQLGIPNLRLRVRRLPLSSLALAEVSEPRWPAKKC